MTKLDCNVVNCSYNEDNCCRREDIHVEGMKAKMPSETSCGSFAANVACDATECKFNREKACSASHIGISGGHADSCKETECGSFECSC